MEQDDNNVKNELVPRVDLTTIDPNRLDTDRNIFQTHFGHPPDLYLRVPGRVNIIGEHIDYCGYAVLPMAIRHDVLILSRTIPRGSSSEPPYIRLINANSEFPEFSTPINEIKKALGDRIDGKSPAWYLYYFCGVLGVLEEFELDDTVGSLEILVDGRVPPRAGLSSSSALVCAATLATLCANNIHISKRKIAELSAKCERYIGTQGGGMDQAIALLATAGSAQFIEFVPKLIASSVSLPSSAIFVVANSLAEANKAANSSYNYRVTECRFASWILAKKKGLKIDSISKPVDVQLALKVTLDELLEMVDKELHEAPYTVDELTKIFNVDEEFLRERSSIKSIFDSTLTFKLRQRIQHVYSEAGRVELFRAICKDDVDDSATTLRTLGKLMNSSHQSLKELYECSHPQLDTLVHLSQAFSHGARLTGAGWGGCMVALVDEAQLSLYLSFLKSKYYQAVLNIDDIEPHVFVTQPSSGAQILLP